MANDKAEYYHRRNHGKDLLIEALSTRERMTLSVYLRPRPDGPPIAEPLFEGRTLSREEFERVHGTSPEELDVAVQYFVDQGFEIMQSDLSRHLISISGDRELIEKVFKVRLGRYRTPQGESYIAPDVEITIPLPLKDIVVEVLGLDSSTQARTFLRSSVNPSVSYVPPQIARAYRYPVGLDGTGECVGLIELGGGFRQSDISAYFSQLGLKPPEVLAVNVDGGSNSPGTPTGPDGEVMLDIEVVGSIAPGSKVAVYFAPNTNQGFIDAISQAVHDRINSPSVISISWGGPEVSWSFSSMRLMQQVLAEANALGVTVTVAAGDNGSTDGVNDGLQHVDFPASAPNALACGGTSLLLDSNGNISSQVTWNDLSTSGGATGGGVSSFFPVPSYQAGVSVPPSVNPGSFRGRGVPDVSGNADPNTGYRVLVDGSELVFGGTSAVAPLIAALLLLLNQQVGHGQGFVHPNWYTLEEKTIGQTTPAFFDVTLGTNGAYHAGTGWDPCTGLGSPFGTAI